MRRKRKLRWLHHGIGAHAPSFIHLRRKKGKK